MNLEDAMKGYEFLSGLRPWRVGTNLTLWSSTINSLAAQRRSSRPVPASRLRSAALKATWESIETPRAWKTFRSRAFEREVGGQPLSDESATTPWEAPVSI